MLHKNVLHNLCIQVVIPYHRVKNVYLSIRTVYDIKLVNIRGHDDSGD